MSRKHATPPNQTVFSFAHHARLASRHRDGADASPSGKPPIFDPSGRFDDGDGDHLADARRASLARLRDTDREDWFSLDEFEQSIADADADAFAPGPNSSDAPAFNHCDC